MPDFYFILFLKRLDADEKLQKSRLKFVCKTELVPIKDSYKS